MKRTTSAVLALLIFLLIAPVAPLYAQDTVPSFALVTWNIQSGQSDPNVIAEQMALFDGVDIWLLQEVNDKETGYYRAGAEDGENSSYGMLMSSAGDGNHLLTLWNVDRFTLVDSEELSKVNTTGNARPALVVHLRDNTTGAEFKVINNHLYSSKADQRELQAALLDRWAGTQTLPMIAGGDMNFEAKSSDPAYAAITADGLWERIAPANDGPTRPNGRAIDHIFVLGPAQQWPVSAQIIERENDLDNEQNSDHRPVIALVGPEVAAPLIPCSTTAQECFLPETSAKPTAQVPASTAIVTATAANLRGGAATSYPIVGKVKQNDTLTIVGRDADGSWLQLENGAWIAAFLVSMTSPTAPVAARNVAVDTPAAAASVPVPTAASVVRAAATPQPPPTAVPQPVAGGALKIVSLDKRAEYAVIRNDGAAAVNLSGWTLLSEKGNQACALGGTIEPGASLTISALGDIAGFNCGFGSNIWNNSERDPAALIAPDGTVVSRLE